MPTLTSLSEARRSRALKGARRSGRMGLLSALSALAVLIWLLAGGLPAQATAPAPAPTSNSPAHAQPGSLTSHIANTSSSISAASPTTPYPLYAWGNNFAGELGNGTTSFSPNPTPVVAKLPAGVTPTAIAAGSSHSLAIGSDGKLYAWGFGGDGELGNGTTSQSATPVVVSLPTGVTPTAIAAGVQHSLAIGSDGKLYAWGDNTFGQLGNGTTTNSTTPVVVSLSAGVTPTAIAAGAAHNLAIGSDGKLYAWGDNQYGESGNGTTSQSATPVVVKLPTGVTPTAIAGGGYHNLTIGSDGKLYAWGDNQYGELGNGTTSFSPNPTPVVAKLPAGITPTAIVADAAHNLAIGSDGKLYAWGFGGDGELGNGTTSQSATPVVVSLPTGVTPTAIAAGAAHSLAIGIDNKLYAWGANAFGQLGNGTTSQSTTPVVVNLPAGTTPLLMAAGGDHSMALTTPPPPQIGVSSGSLQSAIVGTAFAAPFVAIVRDGITNNPLVGVSVTFTAPGAGAGGTFAGGSPVYTATTDGSGVVTSTAFSANAFTGVYTVTATAVGVATPANFRLTNLSDCNQLVVTSSLDDGSCGTLRQTLAFASTNPTKTVTINLTAGSVISLTTGLVFTNGVSITTTASCGVGPNNTMLPPVIIKGLGTSSGNGLTLSGNNRLYGLWVRGFSGVQIKAPVGSSTKMQCVKASNSLPVQAVGNTTASRVYGQGGSFTSNTANNGGASANSLYAPYGVAVDQSGGFYAADYSNSRVLHYTGTNTTADRVYGQGGSFTSDNCTGRISADSLCFPTGVAVDPNGGLYVADNWNNRVLHYSGISTTADRVYGQQGNFTSGTPNNGGISADSLYGPTGVAVDPNGGLYVADQGNSRVLHYSGTNTTADQVYGQGGSFTSGSYNKGGVSANSLATPYQVAVDQSGGVYVTDYPNSRVLHYSGTNTTADRVYGQGGSFTSNTFNNGLTSADSLNNPYGVVVDQSGGVYIADTDNNRVLHYSGTSTTADRVYGQKGSFTSGSYNKGGVSADSLNSPYGVVVDQSGGVYVADSGNNRVLYYGSASPQRLRR